MWTAPTTNTGEFCLEFGTTRFCVDPKLGGRITEFGTGGENVLCSVDDLGDWTNGGSTFWTSPQSAWGWPPNPKLDREPYAAELDVAAARLTLLSPRFEVGGSTLTLSKRFWPDLEREAVVIEYVVHNHGPTISLAGWEVSRVPAAGQTFFAGNAAHALGGLPTPRITTDASGWIWMDHATQPSEAKLGADATRGFVAYVTPQLLFLKTFVDHPAESAAPNEAEVELYVKPGRYVEIEQQGPLREIALGQELSYRVDWYIRGLAPKTSASNADWVLLTQRLVTEAENARG